MMASLRLRGVSAITLEQFYFEDTVFLPSISDGLTVSLNWRKVDAIEVSRE